MIDFLRFTKSAELKSCKICFAFAVFTVLFSGSVFSQPINCYAKITSVTGGNTLAVSNVNQTYASFAVGQFVIVMQMQDDVIGANTTNTASFGNLSAISSAGLYEVAKISSITGAPTPTSITLVTALTNTYNTTANSSVQLISYPTLGTPNYSTASSISAVPWNGNVGGVIAFLVNGILTVNNSITADGAGFRGGVKNTPDGYTACDATTYTAAIAMRYAGKGEGIYLNTTASQTGARGKILNGGGGGNDVNAGGGGGGNYSSGGDGGIGWTPSGAGCSPGVGGLGGISLSAQISGGRIFMGGGGGGGHENDGVGTVGGNGGGIILIRANSLVVPGPCAGISISANGITPANASNDGAGGAGAGGSIVLNVGSYTVAGTCPLTISANGGNGGNANQAATGAHGGGGGGGQGAVIFSGAQPTTNITTQTNAGTGGSSCSGCTSSQNANGGTGPNNSGILIGTSNPLPVELLSFTGKLNGNRVDLDWQTATEINNDYFIIERASDSQSGTEIGIVDGSGNTTQLRSYSFTDFSPNPGMNYYRLRQVDFNGAFSYSNWVSVEFTPAAKYISVYPNPTDRLFTVKLSGYKDQVVMVNVIDITGRVLEEKQVTISSLNEELSMDLSNESAGIYFLSVSTDVDSNTFRVIKH